MRNPGFFIYKNFFESGKRKFWTMPPKKDEEKKMQAPSVPATAPNQTKATKKKRKRRSRKGAANKSVKTKIIEETLSSIGDVDAETSSVLANAGKWDSYSFVSSLKMFISNNSFFQLFSLLFSSLLFSSFSLFFFQN